jgi:hypothetical protein
MFCSSLGILGSGLVVWSTPTFGYGKEQALHLQLKFTNVGYWKEQLLRAPPRATQYFAGRNKQLFRVNCE